MTDKINSIKVNFEALKQSLSKKFGTSFEDDLWLQRLIETIDSILDEAQEGD